MSGLGLLAGLGLAAGGLLPSAAPADHASAGPDDYRPAVRVLQPGDTLRLAPGEYRQGLRLHGLEGRHGAPIVIEGPARGPRAVLRARPGHNTVSLSNASWLVLRNLVIDGAGTGVDAVKAEGFSACDYVHHITLEGLTIVNHGRHQQQVGISTKCPAWGWVVRGNVIRGAGTGIYLGNSDGNAPFVGGLIEGNVVSDTLGYGLQVKHQLPRPQDLPGMPVEPTVTIIRRNVFAHASRGDPAQARPNVLIGHLPLAGPGREDEYHVYGNRFFGNAREALLQAEGNVAIYANLFVNHEPVEAPAVNIRPHNDRPRRVRVLQNTVVARGPGVVVRGGDPAHRQLVAGNAVFAAVPIEAGDQTANRIGAYADAAVELARPYASLDALDLRPRPGRLGGAPLRLPGGEGLTEGDRDFAGRVRTGAHYGAYD